MCVGLRKPKEYDRIGKVCTATMQTHQLRSLVWRARWELDRLEVSGVKPESVDYSVIDPQGSDTGSAPITDEAVGAQETNQEHQGPGLSRNSLAMLVT